MGSLVQGPALPEARARVIWCRALAKLKKLEEDHQLDDYGLWYSGLCHLKLDNRDESKMFFQQLVDRNSYFAEKAKTILKKL